MPKNIHPRVCGNCQFFEQFPVDYDYEDGEVGSCKKRGGEVVYMDDDSWCENFKALKRPVIRAEDW